MKLKVATEVIKPSSLAAKSGIQSVAVSSVWAPTQGIQQISYSVPMYRLAAFDISDPVILLQHSLTLLWLGGPFLPNRQAQHKPRITVHPLQRQPQPASTSGMTFFIIDVSMVRTRSLSMPQRCTGLHNVQWTGGGVSRLPQSTYLSQWSVNQTTFMKSILHSSCKLWWHIFFASVSSWHNYWKSTSLYQVTFFLCECSRALASWKIPAITPHSHRPPQVHTS